MQDQTRLGQQQQPSTKRRKTESSLPVVFQDKATLFHITSFLPLSSSRLFLGTTSAVFVKHDYQKQYEEQISSLKLTESKDVKNRLCVFRYYPKIKVPSPLKLALWQSLTKNLVSLDVGRFGTDDLCLNLRLSECSSTLKSLRMVGSDQVELSDLGLWHLGCNMETSYDLPPARHLYELFKNAEQNHFRSPFQNLEYVDLTFCRNTTYVGTFFLRFGLPKLKILRRLPEWLCGHFNTIVKTNGSINPVDVGNTRNYKAEICTYWADGSFAITNHQQRIGMVRDLQPWKMNDSVTFLGNIVQSNIDVNRNDDQSLFRIALRPGTNVLRLPSIVNDDGTVDECVLVARAVVSGFCPPESIKWMEQCRDLVTIGETKCFYFGIDGQLVETRHPTDFLPGSNDVHDFPAVYISKLKVEPLDSNQGMPPLHIVEKNYEMCKIETEHVGDLIDGIIGEGGQDNIQQRLQQELQQQHDEANHRVMQALQQLHQPGALQIP